MREPHSRAALGIVAALSLAPSAARAEGVSIGAALDEEDAPGPEAEPADEGYMMEEEPPPRWLLAADGALAWAPGDLGDRAGLGLGILARLEYEVRPRLAATGRAGYVYHLPKEDDNRDVRVSQTPLLAGAKYWFADRIWGHLELGGDRVGSTYSPDTFSKSGAETNLALALSGGYVLGGVELHAGVLVADLGKPAGTPTILAGASYPLKRF